MLDLVWASGNDRAHTSLFRSSTTGKYWWRRRLAAGWGASLSLPWAERMVQLQAGIQESTRIVLPVSLGDITKAWKVQGKSSIAMDLHPTQGELYLLEDVGHSASVLAEILLKSGVSLAETGGSYPPARLSKSSQMIESLPSEGDDFSYLPNRDMTRFWRRVTESTSWPSLSTALTRVKAEQASADWCTDGGFSLSSVVLSGTNLVDGLEILLEDITFVTKREFIAGAAIGELMEFGLLVRGTSRRLSDRLLALTQGTAVKFDTGVARTRQLLEAAAASRVVSHVLEFQLFVGKLPYPDAYLALLNDLHHVFEDVVSS